MMTATEKRNFRNPNVDKIIDGVEETNKRMQNVLPNMQEFLQQ